MFSNQQIEIMCEEKESSPLPRVPNPSPRHSTAACDDLIQAGGEGLLIFPDIKVWENLFKPTVDFGNIFTNREVKLYMLIRFKRTIRAVFCFDDGSIDTTVIGINKTDFNDMQSLLDYYRMNFSVGNFTDDKHHVCVEGNPYQIATSIAGCLYSNITVHKFNIKYRKKGIVVELSNKNGIKMYGMLSHKKTSYNTIQELYNSLKTEFGKGNFNIHEN